MNKKNEITTNYVEDVKVARELCEQLIQTKHYKEMGKEGMFAIVCMAKSLGINPIMALNGGIYYQQGKMEMSSRMMGMLIRQKGHSITTSKLNDAECVIHGKRKDNEDKATASFTIEEAKRAGIYKGAWLKYPQDMLYARALSRLARRLFPDVIGDCYVEGEVIEKPTKEAPTKEDTITITTDSMENLLEQVPDYREEIKKMMDARGWIDFDEIPEHISTSIRKYAKQKIEDAKETNDETK